MVTPIAYLWQVLRYTLFGVGQKPRRPFSITCLVLRPSEAEPSFESFCFCGFSTHTAAFPPENQQKWSDFCALSRAGPHALLQHGVRAAGPELKRCGVTEPSEVPEGEAQTTTRSPS